MINWILYLLQSSFCLLIFTLIYFIWLRKEYCFHYRRVYMLTSLLVSYLIPWLKIPVAPGPIVGTYAQNVLILPLKEVVANDSIAHSWDNATVWGLIYLAGVTLMLLLATWKLLRVRRMIQQCSPASQKFKGRTVYLSQGKFQSCSFFNYLILNNKSQTSSLGDQGNQMILLHEWAHIRQGHSYDLVLIEMLKIITWFNPLWWWYSKEINKVHEHLADQVVAKKYNVEAYARILAVETLQGSLLGGLHYFNNQSLTRIDMILKPKFSTPFWKYTLFLAVMSFLLASISCDYQTDQQVLSEDESLQTSTEVNESDKDPIIDQVDEMPSPQGGMEMFYKDVLSNLKYPKEAKENGIEGNVYLEFVVQKDGSVSDVKVLKGIGYGCDEAASELLANSKNWNPGVKDGQPVAVKLQIPIVFKLS